MNKELLALKQKYDAAADECARLSVKVGADERRLITAAGGANSEEGTAFFLAMQRKAAAHAALNEGRRKLISSLRAEIERKQAELKDALSDD